jgi:hypothetical protein
MDVAEHFRTVTFNTQVINITFFHASRTFTQLILQHFYVVGILYYTEEKINFI